jgi:hypothetical protein
MPTLVLLGVAAQQGEDVSLLYASEELRADADHKFVWAAVQQVGPALRCASVGTRADHGIVLAVIRCAGSLRPDTVDPLRAGCPHLGGRGASEEIRADHVIVLPAVRRAGGLRPDTVAL